MAHLYAEDILSEAIPSCIYMKKAAQRYLEDLARASTEWPYEYNTELANRVCRFVELLPHIKGELARQKKNLQLEPWQAFTLCNIFGWVHKSTGFRRFSEVYQELGRKNGKSTLLSGAGLYLLAADQEEGAEVYCCASDREQAKLVWNDSRRMVDKCSGLKETLGVETSAHSIHVFQTSSVMKALSREQGGNHDGLNTHAALIDELHAHKTRDLFDVIESSMGARTQPLLWSITTAGFNTSGICFEKRDFAIKVLDGAATADNLFTVIYTVDPDDLKDLDSLFTDPAIWQKANPNWGVSVRPEFIEKAAERARQDTKTRNNFLTKHLCVWTNTESAWIDMAALSRCADPSLCIDDFKGEVAYKGTDLASKADFASDMIIFPKIIDGLTHIYAFGRHYLPEDTVADSQNAAYRAWADDGKISVTDGNITDYQQILDDFMQDHEDFQLRECGYDPYNANQFTSELTQKGVIMVEVPQTVRYLSEPMKEIDALIRAGRFHYDGCPILTWMFSNVTCQEDRNENIYPRKSRNQKANKIDGVVALIIAMNRFLSSGVSENSLDRFLNSEPITIGL